MCLLILKNISWILEFIIICMHWSHKYIKIYLLCFSFWRILIIFAYIKLVDKDKYDTTPITWVKNYGQVKLPVNKNKQHYILYENQLLKKALLLFVEGTYPYFKIPIESIQMWQNRIESYRLYWFLYVFCRILVDSMGISG